jgi:hypothetical protein
MCGLLIDLQLMLARLPSQSFSLVRLFDILKAENECTRAQISIHLRNNKNQCALVFVSATIMRLIKQVTQFVS